MGPPHYAFSVVSAAATDTLVTPEDTDAVSSTAGAQARLGNFFCSAALYLGWLEASEGSVRELDNWT